MEDSKTEKLFNKNYILLMLVNTLLFISFNMINPVLPEYVTGLGMSVTLAGIISGCFSITALIFRPLSGMAADRFNPKWMYVVAGIGMTIACALYPFSHVFGMLFAVRVLHGIFFAVDTTVSLVMVAKFIPEGKMGQGIGFFGIGNIIAISFAPGLGLKISAGYGAEVSFMIAAVMTLIATLVIFCISYKKEVITAREITDTSLPDKRKEQFSIKAFVNRFIALEVVVFAFLSGIFSFSNSIEYTFMSLYSKSRGIEDISIYFTVSAVFILVSRLFAGKIYDKKGLSVVLYPAFIACTISMTILANASFLWMFLLAAVLKALGQGCGQPSLQSHCIVSVSKDRVGLASSTYYIGPDIMQGIGPIVGGAVIDHAGYEAAYYLCGILLVVGIIVYTICIKLNRKGR